MLPPISWTDRHRTQASGLVWLAKLARPRVPRIGLQPELPVCGRWLFPGKPRQVSRAEAADLRSRDAEPAGPQARQYSATGNSAGQRSDHGRRLADCRRGASREGHGRRSRWSLRPARDGAAARRTAAHRRPGRGPVYRRAAEGRAAPAWPCDSSTGAPGAACQVITSPWSQPPGHPADAPTAAGLLQRSLIGPGQGAGLAGGDGACQDPEGGPQRALRDHREDGRVLPALLGC